MTIAEMTVKAREEAGETAVDEEGDNDALGLLRMSKAARTLRLLRLLRILRVLKVRAGRNLGDRLSWTASNFLRQFSAQILQEDQAGHLGFSRTCRARESTSPAFWSFSSESLDVQQRPFIEVPNVRTV